MRQRLRLVATLCAAAVPAAALVVVAAPVAAAGTASRVDDEGADSYGRWIELDHGGGHRTRFAHLSAQQVSVGQKVAQGKLIGKATDAGRFGSYAGPVSRAAAAKCVRWGGSVGATSYASPYEHCG